MATAARGQGRLPARTAPEPGDERGMQGYHRGDRWKALVGGGARLTAAYGTTATLHTAHSKSGAYRRAMTLKPSGAL
jgi:hypothetical protein